MKTIEEMIAIMTAFKDGKKIECKRDNLSPTLDIGNDWFVEDFPIWNWGSCDYRIKLSERKYIDMGLPSGKLWSTENEEGFYTYKNAMKNFNESLPTEIDFNELIDNTFHRWDNEMNGVIFYSKKTDSELFFPANGSRGNLSVCGVGSFGLYWSSTAYGSYSAHYLGFSSSEFMVGNRSRSHGLSVRLVRESNKHCNK